MWQSPLLTSGLLILIFAVVPQQCATTTNDVATKYDPIQVPEGFFFGAATAAYQIEGAWNVSGKTESVWDVFTRTPGNIDDGTNANDACKSYEFWKRDVEMLKYLGVNSYRFSVSWPRLLPSGRSNIVNPTALDYYNNLINALVEANIEPMITIYHGDLPNNFQDLGGWANPLVSDWMADFAGVLFDNFGDRVKTWFTINEPYIFGNNGYGGTTKAPGLNAHGFGEYIAAKNMLMAHARMYHLYDKHYRPKQQGKIGIINLIMDEIPKTDSESDRQTANDAMLFNNALFMDPIYSEEGGFPERVIELVAQKSAEQGYRTTRLPQLSQEEIDYIKGTGDFFGMNYYLASAYLTRDDYKSGLYEVPSFNDDLETKGEDVFQFEGDEMPSGIRNVLLWVKERYNNPDIIIAENGYLPGAKSLEDQDQFTYMKKYLYTVLDTKINEGVNVIGYIVWSLMDVFEWNSGYTKALGLFQTDFNDENRLRTLRLCGAWYRDVIQNGYVDLYYTTKLVNVSF